MLKWTCQLMSSKLVITGFRPCNVWETWQLCSTITWRCIRTSLKRALHVTFISGTYRQSAIRWLTRLPYSSFMHLSSRIDYCNSLLYGIPECAIKKLQRVQNLAARVVTRSSKYSSITPTLKKLHWLPVKYRIIFKVVLLTFKALHGLAPNNLRTLLQSYIPSRSLRSETGNLLIMPKARRKLGCQSFAVAAPKLWNDLPVNIRTTTSIVSFRSSLKTHLFKLAYAWFVQYHHFTNCCFYLIYNYVQ